MLFYIDRQALSVLKTTLKTEMGWSDTQYGWLVVSFMVPYTLGYFITGRLIDRWGTRVVMPLTLGVMSVATLLSGFVQNLWQMAVCRVVLGLAESAIVPTVLVAIVTWFPYDRRGTANTLNKPLTVSGNILVTPLAVWLTLHMDWRWAFFVPGLFGILIAKLWWAMDRNPPDYLEATGRSAGQAQNEPGRTWRDRAVWGLVLARVISDPLWFFLIFWQPGYLQEALDMPLEKLGRVGWIPFLVSMLFNMAAGVWSDRLIDRGWKPAASRLFILQALAVCSPAVLLLPFVQHHGLAITLLCIVQTMAVTWLSLTGLLMADLIPRERLGIAVAVMSAFGAAMGALVNLLIGPLVEAVGYTPLFIVGALLHPLAACVLWWFYQRGVATPQRVVGAA